MATDPEYVASLVAQLVDGWEERVEYHIKIKRHTLLCQALCVTMPPGKRKHYECTCPDDLEERISTQWQPPLIDQMQEAVTEPVSVAGGGGASGDKPHSNPPGNQEALGWLHDVQRDALGRYEALHGVLYPAHRLRPQHFVNALRTLPDWCAIAADSELYEVVSETKEILRKRVRSARIILGYDTPVSVFEYRCGECGGALIAAADATTDVRCIGTDDAPSCGMKYFRYQWAELLEGEGA